MITVIAEEGEISFSITMYIDTSASPLGIAPRMQSYQEQNQNKQQKNHFTILTEER